METNNPQLVIYNTHVAVRWRDNHFTVKMAGYSVIVWVPTKQPIEQQAAIISWFCNMCD